MMRTRTIATALMISASIGLTACVTTVSLGSGGAGGSAGSGGSSGVAPLEGHSNPCLGDQITTLAENQNPTKLILDNDNVYWLDEPVVDDLGEPMPAPPMHLKRVPKIGGPVVVLATAKSIRFIHVDDQSIYWMSNDGADHVTASLYSTPKIGGGAITTIAVLPESQALLKVDGSSVYIEDTDALTISSMPKSGGAQTLLIPSVLKKTWRLLDSQNIYWHDATDTFSLPKGGGTPTHLTSQLPGAWLRTQNTQNLYFIFANDAEHTLVVSKSGGSQTLLDNGMIPMAVDDHCMYTTPASTPASTSASPTYDTILGAPMNGGTPSTLVTGLGGPAAMAADESGLYWIHPYTGRVMKMAR
jgi:hypothetical protein